MSLLKTPDDSTAVVRIMGAFDQFLGRNPVAQRLQFMDDSFSGGNTSTASGIQLPTRDRNVERKKEIELCTAKSKITRLENEISILRSERKRQRIEEEKEECMERHQSRDLEEKYEDLQESFKRAVEMEKEAREEMKLMKKEYDNFKNKAEQKLQNIQREKLKFSTELDEVKESASRQQSDLRNAITRLEADRIISQNKCEDAQAQLDLLKKRNQANAEELQELYDFKSRTLTAEMKVRELEEKVERCTEANSVALLMQNQLSTYKDLEKQNSKLLNENRYFREMRENCELLKEKLSSKEEKLKRAEARLVDLAKLETQNEELSRRIKKWEVSEGTGISKTRSPVQMANEITRLQQSQAILLEKQGQLKSSAAIHVNAHQKMVEELNNLKKDHQKLQEDHSHLSEQEKRLRRRLILVTNERDGFRRILNTYETEDTINYGTLLMTRAQEAEEKSKTYADQIEKLEEELTKAKDEAHESRLQIIQVQRELEEVNPGSVQKPVKPQETAVTPEMRAKIEELQAENDELKKKLEYFQLKEQKLHMQGDYDPLTTKVVHFSMNPMSLAQTDKAKEVEKLREECEMLRRKLLTLEEKCATGESSDEIQIVGVTSTQEVQELKSQLTSAETKLKRLKEIFSKKIQEFREACYVLTGYKMDMVRDNQYRLQSMYAEQEGDSLLFERNTEGDMMMLSTDFSNTVSEQIEMYLQQYHSIPAFLSTITLDLFSRQTSV